jgi:hypothetical protein
VPIGQPRGLEFAAGLVPDLGGDSDAGCVRCAPGSFPAMRCLQKLVARGVRTVSMQELVEAFGDVAETRFVKLHG